MAAEPVAAEPVAAEPAEAEQPAEQTPPAAPVAVAVREPNVTAVQPPAAASVPAPVPAPASVSVPVAGTPAPKVRRCGHCRTPGHNRTTCPELTATGA